MVSNLETRSESQNIIEKWKKTRVNLVRRIFIYVLSENISATVNVIQGPFMLAVKSYINNGITFYGKSVVRKRLSKIKNYGQPEPDQLATVNLFHSNYFKLTDSNLHTASICCVSVIFVLKTIVWAIRQRNFIESDASLQLRKKWNLKTIWFDCVLYSLEEGKQIEVLCGLCGRSIINRWQYFRSRVCKTEVWDGERQSTSLWYQWRCF